MANPATAEAKTPPQLVVVLIRATSDANFQVIPEVFYAFKELHGEVHWEIDNTDFDFTVTFKEESPFEKREFNSTNPVSGRIRKDAAERYYAYTVVVTHKRTKHQQDNASLGKDPGGIVRG
jgi:hypothetical protein